MAEPIVVALNSEQLNTNTDRKLAAQIEEHKTVIWIAGIGISLVINFIVLSIAPISTTMSALCGTNLEVNPLLWHVCFLWKHCHTYLSSKFINVNHFYNKATYFQSRLHLSFAFTFLEDFSDCLGIQYIAFHISVTSLAYACVPKGHCSISISVYRYTYLNVLSGPSQPSKSLIDCVIIVRAAPTQNPQAISHTLTVLDNFSRAHAAAEAHLFRFKCWMDINYHGCSDSHAPMHRKSWHRQMGSWRPKWFVDVFISSKIFAYCTRKLGSWNR